MVRPVMSSTEPSASQLIDWIPGRIFLYSQLPFAYICSDEPPRVPVVSRSCHTSQSLSLYCYRDAHWDTEC
ncbi:hypothetical protein CPC08DRAFT_422684 [Agrocybe pediades]|nr:hypothetical protein CPC08DRAFT_422684 [Agrocybe pediades]